MRPQPMLSPWLSFVTAALLIAAAACSKRHNPAAPRPPAVQLGTPLTPAGAVFVGGPLLWSAQTDELVYESAEGPLVATHSASGASRTLDPMHCLASALALDGSAVYYEAITDGVDSLLARRIALSPGAVPRTLDRCAILCAHFIAPAPDGDQVAIATLGFDSLLIHRLTTGGQKAVTIGVPIAFSPASTQLLIKDLFVPFTESQIVTIASGATEPASLGTPDAIGVGKVHWTVNGLEVLYVAADRRSLFLRRVAPATTTLIWTSPDTLEAGFMAWSESGNRAAIWSSHRVASTASDHARHYDLHAVDLPERTARIIASADGVGATAPLLGSRFHIQRRAGIIVTTSAGSAVISADETKVAYIFDRRIYRSAFSTSVASATQR